MSLSFGTLTPGFIFGLQSVTLKKAVDEAGGYWTVLGTDEKPCRRGYAAIFFMAVCIMPSALLLVNFAQCSVLCNMLT